MIAKLLARWILVPLIVAAAEHAADELDLDDLLERLKRPSPRKLTRLELEREAHEAGLEGRAARRHARIVQRRGEGAPGVVELTVPRNLPANLAPATPVPGPGSSETPWPLERELGRNDPLPHPLDDD